MTEEQKEQPQPKPQPATEIVKRLKDAHQIALNANGYKATMDIKNRTTVIYTNEGRQADQNSILAEYILRAERAYIENNSSKIMEAAEELLKNDIEEIRELVNG